MAVLKEFLQSNYRPTASLRLNEIFALKPKRNKLFDSVIYWLDLVGCQPPRKL